MSDLKHLFDENTEENENEKTAVYSYVCYLDLLGFKKLLSNAKKNDTPCRFKLYNDILVKIKYLGDILLNFVDTNQKKGNEENIKILMVSDSIYIFFDKETINFFFEALSLITVYSGLHNLYYRGAISTKESLSPTFTNTGLFLGDGIIESYETERDISRYARITVLDEDFLKDTAFNMYISTDNDGISYVSIYSYLKDHFLYISSLYNSYRETVKLFEDCIDCDKSGVCGIEKKPKNVKPDFDNFINIMSNNIYSSMENDEVKNSKYIYSKYYELKKELEKYE